MKTNDRKRSAARSTNASSTLAGAVILAVGSLVGCIVSGATAKPEDDTAVITWSGNASRICVTEPGVVCPAGKDDKITGGKVYWVLDATCFPGGISGPVKYGVLPNCAKDKTVENEGKWEPLVKGQSYSIT